MLGWSMPLFRISGILVSLHVTFFILLAYFAWEGGQAGGIQGVFWTVGFVLLLFACITLHELGHAFLARRYQVPVPRILLTPIGGIAELGFLPEQPRREIAIILAGPAINFALVLLLLPWVKWPSPLIIGSTYVPLTIPGLLQEMLRFNVLMGLFNLLPVFPMDGGRLLRAGLATRIPYVRATK
ncbi:MAG TPA: site-2 protease family protein, partial [Opitutaceae bacterium]|nr:site-2 protease family protein [Opitutaceae bacterium]